LAKTNQVPSWVLIARQVESLRTTRAIGLGRRRLSVCDLLGPSPSRWAHVSATLNSRSTTSEPTADRCGRGRGKRASRRAVST